MLTATAVSKLVVIYVENRNGLCQLRNRICNAREGRLHVAWLIPIVQRPAWV